MRNHINWRVPASVWETIPKEKILVIVSFLYVNQTDPDGTMSWFQEQLLEAEKAGDKVGQTIRQPAN